MEATAKNLLRTALNEPSAEFRAGQWTCIEALMHKRRMLVVQRTGWGKSMVYFLATRMLRDAGEGFTLLISPLLSLMRNQIQAAERIGIRAEIINSANPDDWAAVREKLQNDQVDVLLISPERLAKRLGIPFLPAVRKIKENRQQKQMNNSYQQADNLDGVFSVDMDMVPGGPAFLIDDMVDSRWTFTVIAALLRQAGCPAVFPLALALNSPSGA